MTPKEERELINKVGKLEAKLEALQQSFEILAGHFCTVKFGDADRTRKAFGILPVAPRPQWSDRQKKEVMVADPIVFHPNNGSSPWLVDDAELGEGHLQWMPIVMPAAVLEAVYEKNAEAATQPPEDEEDEAVRQVRDEVKNGTASTRRAATASRS